MPKFQRRQFMQWMAAGVGSTLILPACQGGNTSSASTSGEPAASPAASGAEPFKVGFIYVGPTTDFGYNQAHELGRKYLESNLPGITTEFAENVPETADVERVMERMIRGGAKVIYATSFGYLDSALNVAQRYPDITFLHCGGSKTAPNVSTYFSNIFELMYLGGIAAGKATKSKVLGFVGAFPIPQLLANVNAFTLGAQSVDPSIQTRVVFNLSWADPAKEAEAVNAMADLKADVISMHVDSPVTVVKTAASRGLKTVGYHTAELEQFNPEGWLTGGAWNWGPLYVRQVEAIRAKTFKPSIERYEVKDGYVKLAPFGSGVDKATQDQILSSQKTLNSNSLALFKGPVISQKGEQKVSGGQNLTREQVETMDFLVKGVVGELPTS
ncbi:BMP family ABC transporter substrate-binding protein [Leptolyngbya sp. FACHB-261]|uniref:BMP family ABC transporter substrate-binding protein n=1 Tax=Leptolyngbya sp. FACHB-261 TaxID=2692806 RepID=UPI0016897683|nr:BMP family ABC transporter substrate-binding protein [Leptolyngbya sp. FACHB-261]MBD2102162.1 BMP family ABC transporter substrate-binding protein [Leptolyngbya sp. FACHB-261]